jgi:hypothetical protein
MILATNSLGTAVSRHRPEVAGRVPVPYQVPKQVRCGIFMAQSGRDGGEAGAKAAAEAVFIGKFRVSYTDAGAELQEFTVEAARSALQKHVKGGLRHYSDVAKEVRTAVADKYKGTWHCIVGKGFGSMITQETGQYVA